MVAGVGSGGGIASFSLTRSGHGDRNAKPQHPSPVQSAHNKPVDGSDHRNKPVSGGDRPEGPTVSGDGAQTLTEHFDAVLSSFMMTIANDAMADADDALAETDEDA